MRRSCGSRSSAASTGVTLIKKGVLAYGRYFPRPPPKTGMEYDGALVSRRSFLRSSVVGVAGATAFAGCLGPSPNPRVRLRARSVGEPFTEEFMWRPRGVHSDDYRELMQQLLDEDELTTLGYSLSSPRNDYPTHVEQDGTYYRVEIEETGVVERERWLLWFELLDQDFTPPEDASVIDYDDVPRDLPDTYGEKDRWALERAIPLTEFGPRDVSDEDPRGRGHLFLRTMEDSVLVPEPPFEYLRIEWGGDNHYLEAHTERPTVELRRFRYSIEEVAGSQEEFSRYVHDRYLHATFDAQELNETVRGVLDEAVGGRPEGYQETPPLSAGFKSVLAELGFEPGEPPEPGRVDFSEERYFTYRGSYYRGQVEELG